jgi:DNA-binding transcriptional ArsR family regulator
MNEPGMTLKPWPIHTNPTTPSTMPRMPFSQAIRLSYSRLEDTAPLDGRLAIWHRVRYVPKQRPEAGAQLDQLSLVLQALADPTRRAVVERLGRGPAATSELARPFGMALPSFLQHLEVLERSGLLTSKKVGRVRTYRLAPRGVAPVAHWLDAQRELWERRLDQLDEFLADLKEIQA